MADYMEHIQESGNQDFSLRQYSCGHSIVTEALNHLKSIHYETSTQRDHTVPHKNSE